MNEHVQGGVRVPPLSARPDVTSWTPLLKDLLDLERAGALDGIRAVIAERLGQVRTGSADSVADPVQLAYEIARAGNYAHSAALLAAEIDRMEA